MKTKIIQGPFYGETKIQKDKNGEIINRLYEQWGIKWGTFTLWSKNNTFLEIKQKELVCLKLRIVYLAMIMLIKYK